MNSREEKILLSDFFIDKQDLARQIFQFESQGKGYLPNSAKKAIIPPSSLQFGNKPITLGRIDKYFFLGIEVETDNWKYTAFEDDGMCNLFFHKIPDIDEQTLAFWTFQVNKLAEAF